MSSGISVADEAIKLFVEMKGKHTYQYMTLKFNDKRDAVIIDEANCKKKSECDPSLSDEDKWMEFLDILPHDSARYCVYDFFLDLGEQGKRDRLILIHWSPDTAHVKEKMVGAATKEAVKKALDGVFKQFQASDVDDLVYQTVWTQVSKAT